MLPESINEFNNDNCRDTREFLKNHFDKEREKLQEKPKKQKIENIEDLFLPASEIIGFPMKEQNTEEFEITPQGGKQSKLYTGFLNLPWLALKFVSSVMRRGAEKYGNKNWHNIPAESNIEHAINHLADYLLHGKPDDLTHAGARILMAIEKTEMEKPGFLEMN